MGNPSLKPESFAADTPALPAQAPNGILARVGAAHIARGSNTLPEPGPAQAREPEHGVVIDVPDIGAVRITYRLNSYKHGRSRHWHWLAVHAVAASDSKTGT